MDKQCFRCGKPIEGFQEGGQITISGFYDHNCFPYYKNFTLCPTCHEKLTFAINKCLYSYETSFYRYEEDANGSRDDA